MPQDFNQILNSPKMINKPNCRFTNATDEKLAVFLVLFTPVPSLFEVDKSSIPYKPL